MGGCCHAAVWHFDGYRGKCRVSIFVRSGERYIVAGRAGIYDEVRDCGGGEGKIGIKSRRWGTGVNINFIFI